MVIQTWVFGRNFLENEVSNLKENTILVQWRGLSSGQTGWCSVGADAPRGVLAAKQCVNSLLPTCVYKLQLKKSCALNTDEFSNSRAKKTILQGLPTTEPLIV